MVNENSSPRALAIALEANQLFHEYLESLDAVFDRDFPMDTGVTVGVGGKMIRFKNEDEFADWLAGGLT